MNIRSMDFALVLGIALAVQTGNANEERPEAISSSDAQQGDAARGRETYMAVGCYACHGTVGQGGRGVGPKLAPDPLPLPAMLAIIRHPPGVMPPYSARALPDQAVADIHAYLASIEDE